MVLLHLKYQLVISSSISPTQKSDFSFLFPSTSQLM